ncbi:MAG: bifunctional 5,10-methylenetetrahydrofolate dehydrogenase/5,10-methenyltetrahydrofolate cyclohydrolase [Candidatus Odinarchaeota archaeon]
MVIDGRSVAAKITDQVKTRIKRLEFRPRLDTVLVGSDPASQIYVNVKQRKCNELGIVNHVHRFSISTGEPELVEFLQSLSIDEEVDGILLQLPVPQKYSAHRLLQCIDPAKDVDGLTYTNAGKLITGNPDTIIPCTAAGILELCDQYRIELAGKHACVIGRSNLVGRPVSRLLEGRNATVTLCHSKTKNLAAITRMADILIVAAGSPRLLTGEMIPEDAVVFDVGINRIGSRIVGDVDFETARKRCSYLTPVPGGVGPMTVAMLIKSLYSMALRRRTLDKIPILA